MNKQERDSNKREQSYNLIVFGTRMLKMFSKPLKPHLIHVLDNHLH